MILDVFYAYDLSPSQELYLSLRIKRTFRYILDAYYSDRHPYTIMIIASKVGMYIPPKKRIGLETYKFFINNIKYYENTVERPLSLKEIPFETIYLARDKINLLSYYRDDEIFRAGIYKYSRDYNNRMEALEAFISFNFLIYGEFTLLTNNIEAYATRAKTIFYRCEGEEITYNVEDLISDLKINKFSLHSCKNLQKAIMIKLYQWKNAYIISSINSIPSLHDVLVCLRERLANKIKK